jgi:HEAT repeat protein
MPIKKTTIDELTPEDARQQITEILLRPRPKKFGFLNWEEMADDMKKLGKIGADTLITMLNDPDGNRRCTVGTLLLVMNSQDYLPVVLERLDDPEDFVRWWCCAILQEFNDPRAVEPLTRVIRNDPDGDVRYTACHTLSKIGDERALPALSWVFEHDDGTDHEGSQIKNIADWAIKCIKIRQEGKDEKYLLTAYRDKQ